MNAAAATTGIAAAFPLPNIDTDTIIPIEYCINRERPHFDVALFRRWRYDDAGRERADFLLNREPFRQATVLVTGANFGCGSSREMAVWALVDFGIRTIIGPGFGEIFYNNCFHNGLLAAVISPADAVRLNTHLARHQGAALAVDIYARTITADGFDSVRFELDDLRAEMLTHGLDPIAATLTRAEAIGAFEARDRITRPWAQAPQLSRNPGPSA